MTNAILDFARIALAIATIETHNAPGLTGKGGEVGRYQISAVLVLDYNTHLGVNLSMDEVEKSEAYQRAILAWRLIHYHAKTPEDSARLWNPRAGWYYRERVIKEYERLKPK